MDPEEEKTWVAPGGQPEWVCWFDELAEVSAGERAARLAQLAEEKPELALRLARLFAAEEGAPEILSRPVADRAPGFVAEAFGAEAGEEAPPGESGETGPGSRIGPYRLLSVLGRGGMGEVFLAERADGVFEQQVALKLVKRGMDSEEIVRRFERERQILARLEHPGIARLLDGGTAPDGRPYFVLELVAGEPILAYCRRVKASFEERLRLVIDACEAVDAAHRSLVVHRDLKPSNLLVSAEGQVKLLDFGIAKLLAEAPEEMATQPMRMLLTPAYAAPEQILGEPVTTATDVYALGVILYELLTGRSPHHRGRTPAAVAGDTGGETAERPSAVLREAAAESGEDGAGIPDRRRFARRAQGDLDRVVLAALHRDPKRRYGSAAELGGDLRRFLEGKPIRARADSALYRGSMFLLRHKLASAALLAAVLSLVLGIAVSARQARIATAQAQRAERVKELLLSIFREADPESGEGPELTAREILADGARRVKADLAAEPEVQAELFDAIAQIDRSLGLLDAASEAGEASLAARRKLFGPDSAEAALSLTTLAEILAARGRLDEAERLAGQALPVVERRFGRESVEWQRLATIRLFLLGQQGESSDEALALAREITEAARRRFGPGSVQEARRQLEMAALLGQLSRFEEAEREARDSLAILEVSPRATPLETSYARRLLADLLTVAGHKEEAAAEFAAALDLQRGTVGPDHPEVALTQIQYGFLLSELRRNAEAEKALRDAIRILEPLDHLQIGSARRYLGFCLMAEERYAEAEREFVEVERFLREKVGADHPLVWGAVLSQGWARLRLGRLAEAESTLSRVVAHYERNGPESNEIRSALKYLGETKRLQGRAAEALSLHRRAKDIELKLFGTPEHPGVAASNYQIALDLLASGNAGHLAEARRKIDETIAFQRQFDPEHPRFDDFLVASGRIALVEGDRARARKDLEEAVSRLRARRGPEHPIRREAEDLLQRAG